MARSQRGKLKRLQAAFAARWRRLRFERSEVLFGALVVGLALVVGFVGPPSEVQWYLAIIIWSALVGMMIPRMIEARRPTRPEPAPSDTVIDARVFRHDVASALLTIEGGVGALRILNGNNTAEVETVTHAIETEVRRIRRLSLPKAGTPAQCSIDDTLIPIVSLHRAGGTTIDDSQLEPGASVKLRADDLARAVGNLLDNCALHAPDAAVEIRGSVEAEHQMYKLTIADDGPGIHESLGQKAMERGVSTREGGGLGLFSVRSIVEANGGSVTLDLDAPGTTVHLILPLASHPDAKPAVPPGDGVKVRN